MNRPEAVKLMNRFGYERRPFLVIIDFETVNSYVFPLDSLPSDLAFSMPSAPRPVRACDPQSVHFQAYPAGYAAYRQAFDLVKREITAGNSYLVNLTFSTPVESSLSLWDIFECSHAPFRLFFRDEFVVFSPERFVRIAGGRIHSHPMKGTIAADIPNAAEVLLSDAKEAAEHATIVDLIRNDLSRVALDVNVARYRYLDLIRSSRNSLLQLSSEIAGTLPADYESRLGDILFSLLPAGSVSGAPKTKTIEIIHSAETHRRGFYTGVFGFFDGTTLDSAVMIRFIERTPGGLVYKSGGGITCRSRPEIEYQELIDKIYVPVY